MDPVDFWSDYDWNWASPSDVAEFVASALETQTYTRARDRIKSDH